MTPTQMAEQCYSCKHRRNVPGDTHIMCINPDRTMQGKPHGIAHGWFFYPYLFDPIWRASDCANYRSKDDDNGNEE